MKIEVIEADYGNQQHAEDIVWLLSSYAKDPMGGGKDISDNVKTSLVEALGAFPTAFSVLAYAGEKPAGLINCIGGFSTFAAKPLVNIHDVIVISDYRGLGVSQLMLDHVEGLATDRGCCKLTLEVLEENEVAKNAYRKFGFAGYCLDPEKGQAMFWQKPL